MQASRYLTMDSKAMQMAGIFEHIPTISIAMFVLGLLGVMVYERTKAKSRRPRPKTTDKPSS